MAGQGRAGLGARWTGFEARLPRDVCLGLGCRLRGMPRQVKGKRADGSAQAASGGQEGRIDSAS